MGRLEAPREAPAGGFFHGAASSRQAYCRMSVFRAEFSWHSEWVLFFPIVFGEG